MKYIPLNSSPSLHRYCLFDISSALRLFKKIFISCLDPSNFSPIILAYYINNPKKDQ